MRFVENLQQYAKKPLVDVLQALKRCTGDKNQLLPSYPLSNMTGSVKSTETEAGGDESKGISESSPAEHCLPQRIIPPPDSPLSLNIVSSSQLRASRPWPGILSARKEDWECFTCGRTHGACDCCSYQRLYFIPATKHQKQLDMRVPILKCTNFSCNVYSNRALISCPRCPDGTMGINCSVYDEYDDLREPDVASEPFYLEEELVYAYPFLARKADVHNGLDLTWEGRTERHPVKQEAKPVGKISIRQPMYRCEDCCVVWNSCPSCFLCGEPVTEYSLTFVSADPSVPSKRVYWPLGSINGAPAEQPKAEEGGSVADNSGEEGCDGLGCLVTDSLETYKGMSPVRILKLLKAQGIFCLDDLETVSVKAGTKQVTVLCSLPPVCIFIKLSYSHSSDYNSAR